MGVESRGGSGERILNRYPAAVAADLWTRHMPPGQHRVARCYDLPIVWHGRAKRPAERAAAEGSAGSKARAIAPGRLREERGVSREPTRKNRRAPEGGAGDTAAAQAVDGTHVRARSPADGHRRAAAGPAGAPP